MPEQNAVSTTQTAVARSGLYQLFAAVFSNPTDELLELMLSGEFQERLDYLSSELPYSITLDVKQQLEELDRHKLFIVYTTLFESGSQGVSLRELTYSTLTEKALLEELFRFYQHFGLEFAQGELRELPDLLPIELEFLHYLTFLEAEALKTNSQHANIGALQTAQSDFVNLHPGKWIGSFLERLQSQPDSGIYALLADLLFKFIKQEKLFLAGQTDNLIATD
ncbi:MAG: hypothetical protein HOC70_08630 [Gammaproteobacteria bacterium]|jgi:putative dimethyl sulfoxide reductase chaperone|nr:hypothetical protein [Gammaproteobacteria bacterium]MBT4493299.1 hypothetical protein [Gammaproteobacteria bacterium]MBT7371157.1 hypothetical protein [Gammaproteobacteria bacterium]